MSISHPPCRSCGSPLESTFVDLGMSPLCESYVTPEKLNHAEVFYPLHTYVCGECYLVQLHEYVSPEDIFSDYAYFSSYSDAWLSHCEDYVAAITERLGLDPKPAGCSSPTTWARCRGRCLTRWASPPAPLCGTGFALKLTGA